MRVLLKKYKDKLYTFLVLKNSAIASEYQSYVMADTERHEKHKFKSWLFLIKLNVKYRVFRGNTNLNQLNQPYIDGPESELSNRPLPIHLATRLMEYDVISFDIFDTLILRPFNSPKDVFYYVGIELGVVNFRQERIKAEVEARQVNLEKNNSYEVTIYDIYNKLYNNGVINDVEQGITTEFQVEMEFCKPNPYFADVFAILSDKNKVLYATSDMYFPSEFIEKLLAKCGYTGFESIFVSCEVNKSKAEGTIYNILKDLNVGKQIVHIGDNYTADIVNAKKHDFMTVFYKNVNNIGNQYRAMGLTPIIRSAYSGVVNNLLHAESDIHSFMYEFGMIYGGILVMGYAEFIKRLAMELSIDKILFISRDGYLLNKYANQYWDKSIDYAYLYFSRTLALKACAHIDYKYFLDTIINDSIKERSNTGHSTTIEMLFNLLELEEMLVELEQYEKISIKDLVDNNINILFNFFIKNKAVVLDKFCNAKEYYINYLKSIITSNNNILLVDVGWSGKSILLISKLIEEELHVSCATSLLGMLSRDKSEYLINNKLHVYAYSPINNTMFLEQFNIVSRTMTEVIFTSPEPTIKEIADKFSFGTYEIENSHYNREITNGIFDFIKYYHATFHKYDFMYKNIPGKDAIAPINFFAKNIKLFKHFFDSYVYNITVIHNDNIPIVKPIFSYYQFTDFV